jgi:hypothetical protein
MYSVLNCHNVAKYTELKLNKSDTHMGGGVEGVGRGRERTNRNSEKSERFLGT